MDHTLVDAKRMKTLEEYAIALTMGLLSLNTLNSFHARAIEIGILPEDLECRANTLVWDFKRMINLYGNQLEAVLELTGDFDATAFLEKMKKQQLTTARAMLRKPKK